MNSFQSSSWRKLLDDFMLHLVQLLCPLRHCLVAQVYDDQKSSYQATVDRVEREMAKDKIKRQCQLCDNTHLEYEDRTFPPDVVIQDVTTAMFALQQQHQATIAAVITVARVAGVSKLEALEALGNNGEPLNPRKAIDKIISSRN